MDILPAVSRVANTTGRDAVKTLKDLMTKLAYAAEKFGDQWPLGVIDSEGNELSLSAIRIEVVDDEASETGAGCRVYLIAE